MKKRISLLLAIMLTSNFFMLSCKSESNDSWKENTGTIDLDTLNVSGNGVSVENNIISIVSGGDFEVFGELSNGMIYVSTEERVKLRLSGASITNESGPAIFFDNVDKGFITITENTENFLSDGAVYTTDDADAALFSNDDLEIKGSGILNITGSYKHGIAGDDDVKIENGTINITSNEHGIKANDTLSILGGNITADAKTGKGLKSELELIIEGGALNITSQENEGIESKGTLTINGGDISITATDDGINTGNSDTESQMPQNLPPQWDMQRPEDMPPQRQRPENIPPQNTKNPRPQGGGFHPGGGFGMVDAETAAAHAVTINGGNIYINTACDGIDSNGNPTITGGKVIIDGPERGGNGPLDSQGTMSITGGTVITTSSAGMIQLPQNTDTVNILRVYFTETQSAKTKVSVTSSDYELLSLTPQNAYQALIVITADLKENTEYTICLNDEKYESFTAVSGTTSVGSFGGGRTPKGNWGQNRGNRQNNINIPQNGQSMIKKNYFLVAFRTLLDTLGIEVTWDNATKQVLINSKN